MDDITSIVNLALTVLTGLRVLIGLIAGISRGTYRSLVRMACVVAAAALAVLAAVSASHNEELLSFMKDMVLPSLSSVAGLQQSDVLNEGISEIVRVSAAVVLYIPFFFLFELLMLIPGAVIGKLIGKKKSTVQSSAEEGNPVNEYAYTSDDSSSGKEKKRDFPGDRWIGMLIGAVNGLLIISLLLSPVLSLSGVVRDVLDTIGYDTSDDTYLMIAAADEHFITKVTSVYDETLMNGLTKAEIGGQQVQLKKELPYMIDLYFAYTTGAGEGESILSGLPQVFECVTKSDLMSTLLINMSKEATEFWNKGESYMGIAPDSENTVNGVLVNLFEAIAQDSREEFTADLIAFGNLINVLKEYELLEAFSGSDEKMTEMIMMMYTDEDFIAEIDAAVESSPNVCNLILEIKDIIVAG